MSARTSSSIRTMSTRAERRARIIAGIERPTMTQRRPKSISKRTKYGERSTTVSFPFHRSRASRR